MIKIKSSALMIALVLGVVLSGILVGVVLSVGQQSESSAQARDGGIAYRAALSGVDDGLLRYKNALSQAKVDRLYGPTEEVVITDGDETVVEIKYDLTFKMDSISVGENLDNPNTDVVYWKNNANKAIDQNAMPLISDDFIDIDLTYLINNPDIGISSIEVFYSNPFVQLPDGSYSQSPFQSLGKNPFSAMNVKLMNINQSGEEQLVFQNINNSRTINKTEVEKIAVCSGASKECHLQIKPQVAFVENDIDSAANRLSGQGINNVASSDKYVFIKIRAKDSEGNIIEPTGDMPGTITVESVGYAGEAVRKLQGKIDASSGNYVGLLDFGVYCGDKCNMPSVRGVPQ